MPQTLVKSWARQCRQTRFFSFFPPDRHKALSDWRALLIHVREISMEQSQIPQH